MKWTSKAEASAPASLSAEALRGKALALLTRREHSRAELQGKLVAVGGEAAQVTSLLDELVELRLQSDERFVEAFVRSRVQRGNGPLNIGNELRQRGVASELVSALVQEGEQDWYELARQARERRFGQELPAERREQARQLRFLQYRGFSAAQAMKALRYQEED